MPSRIKSLFSRSDLFALTFLCALSSFFIIYYFHTGQHLPYADAMSRLNIARKIVDNLNPGLAQIGSVWLPLPQVAMLPFIWNEYLWHSGLAGSFMSGLSFILGGYFLYRAAKLITESRLGAFLTLCIYALNINVLYLQSTAMSECIFMATLSAVIYFFLVWVKSNQRMDLVPAGIAVSALTLIRYEALPILFASIPMVLFYSIVKNRSLKKVEGDALMYITIAATGFLIWTIYLAAIFHDPLFWVRYYAAPSVPVPVATASAALKAVSTAGYSQSKPFMAAVWQYFTSVTWMSGVIPVGFAMLGLIILPIRSIRDKSWFFLPVLMPLAIFLFMVLTLQRNTPIVQPTLSISSILGRDASNTNGFNIRYGLMMFPWVVVMCAYVFSLKKFYLNVFIFLLFGLQLYTYIPPNGISLIYRIPQRIYGKPYSEVTEYMKSHYDGGEILISASGFEDQMFLMGFPYKTYIHEGTGKYWKESLDSPSRYATWIITDFGHPEDTVGKELKHKNNWQWAYEIVYNSPTAKIYKVIDKPLLEIPGTRVYHPKPRPPSKFVLKKDNELVLEGKPFRFVGANAYDLMYQSHAVIDATMKEASASGIRVVRFWAYGEGRPDGVQPKPWQFNQGAYDSIGYVVASAARNNLKVIPVLGNYQGELGGVPQYLTWDGLPSGKAEQRDEFFRHKLPRTRFEAQIRSVIISKNPYTGSLLKDDPTILGWEIMHEPRSSSAATVPIVTDWISDMTSVIKSTDANHLVLPGTEGFTVSYGEKGERPSAAEVGMIPSVDAVTAHYYETLKDPNVQIHTIFNSWKTLSDDLKKPLIIEEVGIGKGKTKKLQTERAAEVQEILDELKTQTITGVFLFDWSFDKKSTRDYGISPADTTDTALVQQIREYIASQNP